METKYPIIYLNDKEIFLPFEKMLAVARQRIESAEVGKINLAAFSRWGLAARVIASEHPEKIASVTTICTSHRGLRTVGKRLGRPAVTCWGKQIGGEGIADAVTEMCPESMRAFNEKYPNVKGVFYQSCACAMDKTDDKRLAAANSVISVFDGENDGVASVYSALWGQYGIVLRGVSHLSAGDKIPEELIKSLVDRGL